MDPLSSASLGRIPTPRTLCEPYRQPGVRGGLNHPSTGHLLVAIYWVAVLLLVTGVGLLARVDIIAVSYPSPHHPV